MSLLIASVLMQMVSERDQATRGAALMALEAAYSQLGQDLWPLLGRLTDQQRSLIEERLKFADRAAERWVTSLVHVKDFSKSAADLEMECPL